MIIIPDGPAPFFSFQLQVSLLLVISQERTLNDPFFFLAHGLSSDVVLRLSAHSTSRNPVPVAAPQ